MMIKLIRWFQFLIGRLKTQKKINDELEKLPMFQFLIGRLKTLFLVMIIAA